MSFNSKYSGQQVEALLDQVANGNTGGGGGGGITTELDPIFSASPAAKITDDNISSWNNKVDKENGKQLSTEDFTTLLKQKLDGLFNYDDTEIRQAVSKLRTDLDTLVSGDTTNAIKTFNEVIAFLDGLEDTEDLASIIASIEQQIAGKMDKVTLASVATSGNYNDLSNKPTIPDAVTESTVSGWGFTKNTGTYSKPSTGIPNSDLAGAVQTSLRKADTALQSYTEQYKGTVTSIKFNGTTKTPDTSGMVDLGTIGGGGGSSSGGESSNARKEVVYEGGCISHVITAMRPNVVYWLESIKDITIDSFEAPLQGVDSYDIFTVEISLGNVGGGHETVSLTLPDYVLWANGEMPDLSEGYFELSISRISDGDYSLYFAELTRFE